MSRPLPQPKTHQRASLSHGGAYPSTGREHLIDGVLAAEKRLEAAEKQAADEINRKLRTETDKEIKRHIEEWHDAQKLFDDACEQLLAVATKTGYIPEAEIMEKFATQAHRMRRGLGYLLYRYSVGLERIASGLCAANVPVF